MVGGFATAPHSNRDQHPRPSRSRLRGGRGARIGVPISLNRALETLEESVGRRARKHYVEGRPGDQRHTRADLGFEPDVSRDHGLPHQVAWQNPLSLAV